MQEIDGRFPADAVFEGGGVKGIGLIGALSVMERRWHWENVAGTSAGSIVAACVACGMTATDVRAVLDQIDLSEMMDRGWEGRLQRVLSRISLLRRITGLVTLPDLINVLRDFGIYQGKRFIEIVEENLPRDAQRFGDPQLLWDPGAPKDSQYRYKLRVVASDVTANRMLILPQDIRHFGRDPDELTVAEAVRMSMSIPVFFEPWRLRDRHGREHLIVDGGILSNYPVWMFDAPPGETPGWPTFGFRLHDPGENLRDGRLPFPEHVEEIGSFVQYMRGIWDTVFSAMDRQYVSRRHWARTIAIDNLGVGTTEFDITEERKDALWASGVTSAEAFMKNWGEPQAGFDAWVAEYRGEVEEAERLAQASGMETF